MTTPYKSSSWEGLGVGSSIAERWWQRPEGAINYDTQKIPAQLVLTTKLKSQVILLQQGLKSSTVLVNGLVND